MRMNYTKKDKLHDVICILSMIGVIVGLLISALIIETSMLVGAAIGFGIFVLFGFVNMYNDGDYGEEPTLRQEASWSLKVLTIIIVLVLLILFYGDIVLLFSITVRDVLLAALIIFGIIISCGNITHNYPE
jgi:hypothetical protein